MFRNWGFLMSEMIGLLILAALLGLLVGWWIWARGRDGATAPVVSSGGADAVAHRQLSDDLTRCRTAQERSAARIAELEAELAARVSTPDSTPSAFAAVPGGDSMAPAATELQGDVAPVDLDGDGEVDGLSDADRPAALAEARGGQPDDLKRIRGIGPKLEQLCHSLGFFHFDQIAGWTDREITWVDANLTGFKGRVSRDNWMEQAKALAAGSETEFSRRVDKGDVY
ncbi:Predicted 5' DNA nuclease, flap endonuclease-1-like, helix-3-turn-helix (H3TH) domain [Thalassovita taeanensis]|uniref:Predicted 5' DNA nuclease, flap endonuclease-1-like, helix-3-turn-helix (H3TH) domain n=2 Tax=Thalassovita taeanensis TaxID=657014 RepID=A0A1H9CRJ2_9RHOB|nr:Predicted 5' DNA nuclease, flap endonuclease-1-like, helix-3-turn-helix (H3TH) domain [Thalassovita taeanensis]